MKYLVKLDSIFHIWFSINNKVGINKKNAQRLEKFKKNYPSVNVTLIYSSDLLTKEADLQFQDFAKRIGITLLSIPITNQDEIKSFFTRHSLSNTDIKLYHLACSHLTTLNNGGNPAVASDLLRWIFLPLDASFAVYSDIDTEINLEGIILSKPIRVDAPLLLPLSKSEWNTDVIVYPSVEKGPKQTQLQLLNPIKRKLLESCQKPQEGLQIGINFAKEDSSFSQTLLLIAQNPRVLDYLVGNANVTLIDMTRKITLLFSDQTTYMSQFAPENEGTMDEMFRDEGINISTS